MQVLYFTKKFVYDTRDVKTYIEYPQREDFLSRLHYIRNYKFAVQQDGKMRN